MTFKISCRQCGIVYLTEEQSKVFMENGRCPCGRIPSKIRKIESGEKQEEERVETIETITIKMPKIDWQFPNL